MSQTLNSHYLTSRAWSTIYMWYIQIFLVSDTKASIPIMSAHNSKNAHSTITNVWHLSCITQIIVRKPQLGTSSGSAQSSFDLPICFFFRFTSMCNFDHIIHIIKITPFMNIIPYQVSQFEEDLFSSQLKDGLHSS